MSPDTSMIAMHGSVQSSFPFPRGGNHEGRQDDNVNGNGAVGTPRTPDWQADPHPSKSRGINEQVERPSTQAQGQSADSRDVEANAKNANNTRAHKSGPEPGPINDGTRPLTKNNRLIAIDFDDVCTQGMLAMLKAHNEQYGTDLTLDDLESYVFWQNKGWGTPADCARKKPLFADLLHKTAPVSNFAPALQALHKMGHPLHIVTSRPEVDREKVAAWLGQYGITIGDREEDVIAAAWFTHTYSSSFYPTLGEKGDTASAVEREEELNERLREVWREGVESGKGGKGKLKVLREIGASLFIDDHHGNLDPIVTYNTSLSPASPTHPTGLDAETGEEPNPKPKRIECLLFGTYAWNRGRSGLSSPVEMLDYDKRVALGLPLPFEEIEFGKATGLYRAEGWEDVVRWVERWDAAAAAAEEDGEDCKDKIV